MHSCTEGVYNGTQGLNTRTSFEPHLSLMTSVRRRESRLGRRAMRRKAGKLAPMSAGVGARWAGRAVPGYSVVSVQYHGTRYLVIDLEYLLVKRLRSLKVQSSLS